MAKKKMTLEEKLEEAIVKDVHYEVPENWMLIKLGYLGRWGSGGTPSRKHPEYYEGTIPWIKTGELKNNYIYDAEEKITDEAIKKSSAKIFIKGSVLLAMYGATIGKVAILGIDATTNQACAAIECNELIINNKFMFYYLLSQKDNFIELGKGGAQPNISQMIIKEYKCPVPPLKEQQRIVDKIESLFEKLDKANELIEEARDDFEKRKSAILEKAFRGELTKEWRSKKNIEYKDSWKSGIFEDLCVLSRGFDLPSRLRVEGEYLLVSSSGSIDTHNEAKMRAPGVVTGRSGSIGKVFYIEKDFWPLNTTLYVKEFKGNYEKYVYYYLSKFDFKKYSSSTAVPTLNRNNFKGVSIMFPCLEEQKEIVRILDDLLEQESKIEELTKLDEQIELIKKSILAKAFRGQLGTNSEEDESALEVLKELLNT